MSLKTPFIGLSLTIKDKYIQCTKAITALVLLLASQTALANDNAEERTPPPTLTLIELVIQMLTPGGTYQPPP